MKRYIIANFDRNEFLRPAAFGEKDDLQSIITSHAGALAALAVLLADGNGRGGGDLSSDAAIIGSWAGARVALIDDEVRHGGFSQPGLEDVPLQQQFLSTGRDVSDLVFDAILEAERAYWDCALLNRTTSTLGRVTQRSLSASGKKYLLSAEGLRESLVYLEDLFGIFMADCPITPAAAVKALQAGLDKTGQELSITNRWTVQAVRYQTGAKWVPRRGDTSLSSQQGINQVDVLLCDREANMESTLRVRLCAKHGSCAQELFAALFPDAVLVRPKAVETSVQSEYVAKLLAGLNLSANQERPESE